MKKFHIIRLFVFLVATLALAKFFEAGRLISSEMTFRHLSLCVVSLFTFLLSLLTLGYWVYKEEKEKNNLKHKFWLYDVIARSKATKQSHDRKNVSEIASPSARNDIQGGQ